MTFPPEVLTMSQIGRDIALEGIGESLFRVALAAVKGQVPANMEMAVATQILVDCGSAMAATAVMRMPPAEARVAIVDLANGFRASALSRLDHFNAQGTQE